MRNSIDSYISECQVVNYAAIAELFESLPLGSLSFQLSETKYQETLYRFLTATTAANYKRAKAAWNNLPYAAGNALWGSELDPASAIIVLSDHWTFPFQKVLLARDILAESVLRNQVSKDNVLDLIGHTSVKRKLPMTPIIERYSAYLFSHVPEYVQRACDNDTEYALVMDGASFEKVLFLEQSKDSRTSALIAIMNVGLWLCPKTLEKHLPVFEVFIGVHNFVNFLTKVVLPADNAFTRSIDSSSRELRIRAMHECSIDIEENRSLILPENSWVFNYFGLTEPVR